MNNTPKSPPVYVECERCGTRILEQSAIEENGMLLCGECVVSGVKRDVSKAEAKATQQRNLEHKAERAEIRKQQQRRALIVMLVCVAGFIISLGLSRMYRDEPVQTQHLALAEHPDIARSMLRLGIYKYQQTHDTLPKTLKDLAPEYLSTELAGTLDLFDYTLHEDNSYTLELKSDAGTPAEPQQNTSAQGVDI